MIYIVGLGAGDENQLPLGVINKLKENIPIFLRTDQHPMINFFNDNHIPYTSFDSIYEKNDTFEEVYAYIIAFLKKESINKDIIYGVPGHPCVAEYAVKILLEECECKVVGGQSFLDSMFASLHIDPIDGIQIADALSFNIENICANTNLIVAQVFDQLSASNLKLDLMELYPYDHKICIVSAAGSTLETLKWCPLFELDHTFKLSNLTSLYIPALNK